MPEGKFSKTIWERNNNSKTGYVSGHTPLDHAPPLGLAGERRVILLTTEWSWVASSSTETPTSWRSAESRQRTALQGLGLRQRGWKLPVSKMFSELVRPWTMGYRVERQDQHIMFSDPTLLLNSWELMSKPAQTRCSQPKWGYSRRKWVPYKIKWQNK